MAGDAETTGLDPFSPKTQVTHLSHWSNDGQGQSFPVDNHEGMERMARLMATGCTKLFFNAPFDTAMLLKTPVRLTSPVICVLLMAQIALPDEKTKKLKPLCRKYLKDPMLEEIRLKKWLAMNPGKHYGDAPKHIIEPYNLKDSRMALELFYYLSAFFDKHDQWTLLEREMLLMRRVVIPMENRGVNIDLAAVDALKIEVRDALKNMRLRLSGITNNPRFNPNSPQQVLAALTKEGTYRPTRFSNKTGKPKTDKVALLETPSELGTLILQYRKIDKAQTTYLKRLNVPLLRVHFNQGGARTGRFSSSGPNLQNIPRPEESFLGKIRRCFIPRPGCRLLFIDYKQLQLRLAAHFSEEDHMLRAIGDGKDLHDETCKLIFDIKHGHKDWDLLRYLAKTINFSELFGAGPPKIRETILEDTDGRIRLSLATVARHVNEWKAKHPRIMALFTRVAVEVSKTGGVTTPYGRYLPVDPYKSYVGVNYLIQGTEADFMKQKMFLVEDHLKPYKTKLLMTVHDELIFNWHRDELFLAKELKDIMEDYTTFKVPLICSVSYGKNWQDKKKLAV